MDLINNKQPIAESGFFACLKRPFEQRDRRYSLLRAGFARTKDELDISRFIQDSKQTKALLRALTTQRLRDLARNTSGLSIS